MTLPVEAVRKSEGNELVEAREVAAKGTIAPARYGTGTPITMGGKLDRLPARG